MLTQLLKLNLEPSIKRTESVNQLTWGHLTHRQRQGGGSGPKRVSIQTEWFHTKLRGGKKPWKWNRDTQRQSRGILSHICPALWRPLPLNHTTRLDLLCCNIWGLPRLSQLLQWPQWLCFELMADDWTIFWESAERRGSCISLLLWIPLHLDVISWRTDKRIFYNTSRGAFNNLSSRP